MELKIFQCGKRHWYFFQEGISIVNRKKKREKKKKKKKNRDNSRVENWLLLLVRCYGIVEVQFVEMTGAVATKKASVNKLHVSVV